MSELIYTLFPFTLAVSVAIFIIPCWISVCSRWNLFEPTCDRRKHRQNIPSMGGIGIYAAVMLSFTLISANMGIQQFSLLIPASAVLFFTGFFDDLLSMAPSRKLLLQILTALIVAGGGLRLSSLHGILGIHEIPIWAQYLCTVFFIILITNAFNLIDGIDGLAGSLGLIAALVFGMFFQQAGMSDGSILCFSLAGALGGFLVYNFNPAKVFMGDTGSLMLGFLLSVAAISLLEMQPPSVQHGAFSSLPVVAALFIPVYDVLRVSVIRMITGKSPFHPDRNHIHHMILGTGFGQRATTVLITLFSLMLILLSLMVRDMNINFFILMSICLGMICINTRSLAIMANIYGRLGGRLFSTFTRA